MMREVHLYGRLAKHFGKKHRFDVDTAAEAVRALNCAFPGKFMAVMKEGSYRVIRGRRRGGMDLVGKDMTLELFCELKLGHAELHIVPIAAGSKNNGGAVKAALGVALVGAAIFFSGGTLAAPLAGMNTALPGVLGAMNITWGNIALIGLGLTLAGVSSALSKPDEQKSTSSNDSFTLSGPGNTNEQGNPVQLVYGGPIIVGTQAVSVGFDIEDYGAGAPASGDADGDGIPDDIARQAGLIT
jgi:predicted phage tail protein